MKRSFVSRGAAEARELAHRPQLAAIARRMNAARERVRAGHAELGDSSASATSSAVYSGSTSRCRVRERDVALLACLVARDATPPLRRAAARARPARSRVVLGELTHRRHVVVPLRQVGRCAPAARRRRRTASPFPTPAAGSCASSHADRPVVRPQPLTQLRFHDVHHAARAAAPRRRDCSSPLRLKIRKCRSSASTSSSIPSPFDATVRSTGGVHASICVALPRPRARLARGFMIVPRDRRRDAPARSRASSPATQAEHQLDARCAGGRRRAGRPCSPRRCRRSPSDPAFSVWIESPDSGTRITTVVSAVRATSSSLWPTPTVSMRMRSKPNASSTSAHLARGRGRDRRASRASPASGCTRPDRARRLPCGCGRRAARRR